jgi:hypothetical protein
MTGADTRFGVWWCCVDGAERYRTDARIEARPHAVTSQAETANTLSREAIDRIGARLFISPRTVQYHVAKSHQARHQSRNQLVRALPRGVSE